MEENLENYNKLINRLKFGNRSTFRDDLELLAETAIVVVRPDAGDAVLRHVAEIEAVGGGDHAARWQ